MLNESFQGWKLLMNKWGLIIKAAGITGVLLIVQLVFDYLNYDVLSLTNLITAFISSAIFTVAILCAGVLTDLWQSEKKVGENSDNVLRTSRSVMS